MSNKVIMGYGENWYPKTEPVIPRVYHEYLKDSDKANIYTAKELDIEFAYFACNPENYDVFNGAGTNVKLNLEKINKVKLVPRVGGTNNTTDVVKTAPSITNLDEDPTYVRLHIAIPACLDDALPTFNASYNMLHFNSKKDEALITGTWNWSTSMDRESGKYVKDNNWNYYPATIDGIDYNVYIATYETALEKDQITEDAIFQVYLDEKAAKEDIQQIFDILNSDTWEIKYAVEAVKAEEYADPFAAFDAAGKSKVF